MTRIDSFDMLISSHSATRRTAVADPSRSTIPTARRRGQPSRRVIHRTPQVGGYRRAGVMATRWVACGSRARVKTLACAFQRLGNPRREGAEHAAGARALEGDQALHHRLLAVEPAVLRGRHDHRIFTRHLLRAGRHTASVLHPAPDID